MTSQPTKARVDFVRIVADPEIRKGKPFLKRQNVEIAPILAMIDKGLTDNAIIEKLARQYPKAFFTVRDIDACRSFQARFMPETLSRIFNRHSRQNYFMVDENITALVLYDVARLFGPSSHVQADSLNGKDDEKDIWAHVIKHKYAAVLTSDADFIEISQRYRQDLLKKYGTLKNCPEHVPAVVWLSQKNYTKDRIHERQVQERIVKMLEDHHDEIVEHIRRNDCAYAVINRKGFSRHKPNYLLKAGLDLGPS